MDSTDQMGTDRTTDARELTAAPILLDAFCGAGGAGEGYRRSGFDVIGVDHKRQPNYPFQIFYGDVIEILGAILDGRWVERWGLPMPQGIHASPPCQAHSDLRHRTGLEYPELVAPVRELLEETGLPWIIENVEGAPLRDPVTLCGTMFPGLRVLRHRLFESNFPLETPAHPTEPHPPVFTTDKRKSHYGKLDQDISFVSVTGGGNCSIANARSAMGIEWMTKPELNEAIPPAYTEYLGRQLLSHIESTTTKGAPRP